MNHESHLSIKNNMQSIARDIKFTHYNVFVIQIVNCYFLKKMYGHDIMKQLIRLTSDITKSILIDLNIGFSQILSHEDKIIAILKDTNTYGQNSYNVDMMSLTIEDIGFILKMKLKEEIKKKSIALLGREIDFLISYKKYFDANALRSRDAHIFESINRDLNTITCCEQLNLYKFFKKLINVEGLGIAYQPIVNLITGEIQGWEALCRITVPSPFNGPKMLFEFAEELGELFILEKKCRYLAITNIGDIQKEQKIFINVNPMTIIDPNFKPGETANILKQFNLSPDNIVFEITEHSSTANFSCFHKMLNHYRNQGYKVAIDDVGAGYAGLVALADIQPDYIKLDRSLTSDLCKNKMKQSIIASIVTLSKYNGTTVIAEGIETKEDMDILVELGVLLGQGYYIAKPAYPKPLPNLDIFKNSTDKKFFSYLRTNIRLKELSIKSTVIESGTPINVVKDKMDKSVDPINYLVITKGTKPLGVVKSFVLDKKLSTLYGTSLYYNKPIDTFMERDCIIVDEDTTLDEISKILLQKKDKTYLYECIVLTKHSKFSGIVPFDKLIHQLFEIQIQLAKGSNPLTGLPGNIAIEREIEKRMNSNILFEIAYIDMDNFKAYNDAYGFKAGDKIILLLAKIISHICNKKGKGAFFIGHVGGDDFVIIGSANKLEKMCHCIVSLFERLSKVFYSKEDLQNGFITGKTREGNIQKYPLITLSIGILRCRGYCSFSEFSKRVAEIKSYAKSIKGNSVVVDRRQVLGNK